MHLTMCMAMHSDRLQGSARSLGISACWLMIMSQGKG